MGGEVLLEGKRVNEGEGVVSGVPGAADVIGPSLAGITGATTGRRYRNFKALYINRLLSNR
jgi:hypothetical protein